MSGESKIDLSKSWKDLMEKKANQLGLAQKLHGEFLGMAAYECGTRGRLYNSNLEKQRNNSTLSHDPVYSKITYLRDNLPNKKGISSGDLYPMETILGGIERGCNKVLRDMEYRRMTEKDYNYFASIDSFKDMAYELCVLNYLEENPK
jgi:hypothetical protein